MSDFVEQIRRQAKDSVSGELFGKEAHKSTLLWSVADHIDSLEQQLAYVKDLAKRQNAGWGKDKAALHYLREAAGEAKELLWKMQSVQPFIDEVHYVGGKLNAALQAERSTKGAG